MTKKTTPKRASTRLVQTRIPTSVFRLLRGAAVDEGLSMAAYVRRLLMARMYMSERDPVGEPHAR